MLSLCKIDIFVCIYLLKFKLIDREMSLDIIASLKFSSSQMYLISRLHKNV